MADDPPADPDRYDEAVRAFRRRVPMTDPEFRKLEADERQKAFWVAGVTQARVVQEIKDALERAVRDGTTLEDFKVQAGGKLAEAWGGADAPRLETVFRTNVLGAYNGGRTEIFDDPVIREARPFLRFDAVGDSRTSEICEALDGTVLPADDPFWEKHTPPLHPNCRSIVTPLSPEEADDEGITKGKPDTGGAEPAEGFGRPQRAGEGEPPDTSGFDDDIESVLKSKMADAPPPPPPPPPEAPVDYGPLLPKAEPIQHPRELPETKAVKLKSARWYRPQLFIKDNEKTLARLAGLARELTGTGVGVDKVAAVAQQGGAAGTYHGDKKLIQMSPKYATLLGEAARDGAVTTHQQKFAVHIVLHESMHGASERHRYRSPQERALEEATTDMLSYHHIDHFIEKSMGLKLAYNEPRGSTTYGLDAAGEVAMMLPSGYAKEISNFGRIIRFIDEVDVDKVTAEQFDQHVAGRALQVKRTAADLGQDARYGLLVRPLLERAKVTPDHPRYEEIVDGLRKLLGDGMVDGALTHSKLQEGFDRIIRGDDA